MANIHSLTSIADVTHHIGTINLKNMQTRQAHLPSINVGPNTSLGQLRNTERDYHEVHVLLLTWDGDLEGHNDLWEEAETLRKVLVNDYKFIASHYRLPSSSKHPANRLRKKLDSFKQDLGNPGNLLIIYYGGHGTVHRSVVEKKVVLTAVWGAHQ
jgi:hypothetical protein